MAPGDIFITNDPWKGTGHLFDFTVVTPAFLGSRLVGLFACTTHVVDVGGRQAGPDAQEVYEEGLRIPICRMARNGEIDELLLAILRVNVRDPVQVVGDLLALAACNDSACRQLGAMLEEYGLQDLEATGDFILSASRTAMLEAIRAVPAGTYRHTMRIDGYDEPVDLALALDVHADGVRLDFAGSSPQSRYGINVPLCYTAAYASFGLKCAIAPEVPNNAGSLGLIEVTATPGSITHALEPAAVTARHVVGQMLPDLVFGCLHQALPDSVPAEGTPLWLLVLSGTEALPDGGQRRFGLTSFHNGGTGARPGADGLSATSFPSGIRSVSVEVVETLAPLLFVQKALLPDSSGAGRWRGGLGQILQIRHRQGLPFRFAAMLDRVTNAPRGRDGGHAGRAGKVRVGEQPLKPMGAHIIPAGADLIIETPGGGGLGDSRLRDRAAVAADVAAGYLGLVSAQADYGFDALEASPQPHGAPAA
jgi:N-methylhydantoinase B